VSEFTEGRRVPGWLGRERVSLSRRDAELVHYPRAAMNSILIAFLLPVLSDHGTGAPPGAGPRVTPSSWTSARDAAPSVSIDVDAAGTTWVRGRTYKAAFSAERAEYIPFLGSRAPRNYPVAFDVESVTLAGVELAFDRDVAPVRRGDAIEYERGPFRERWLLTPDSVEQTFEFDELARRGEIVVELAVATDLEVSDHVDGFRFGNELGHVHYGRAFAYHDALARTSIDSRIEGGRITLSAPASLVESAVGRFVIDPVFQTFSLDNSAPDQFSADTAYDAEEAHWFTVYEEVFSDTDHDVVAVRHWTTGGNASSQYIDSSNEDWRSPAIANNNMDDQFLVVAARGAAPNRDVWARPIGATPGMIMLPKFLVSDGGQAGDHHSPDVGGDIALVGNAYYCVVWQNDVNAGDSNILGRMVETDGTVLGGATLAIDTSVGTLDRNPAMSSSNGHPTGYQRWHVVWEHEVAPTNRDIRGRRVDADGVMPEASFSVAASVLDERNPSATSASIAFNGVRPWMVAYQIQTGANGWDVRCRTLDGTSVAATFDLSEQFPSVALDQITPSCDTVQSQFVVAWDERPAGVATTSDIRVATLFSVDGGLALNEGDFSVSPGLHLDARPRIVAMEGSDEYDEHTLVVFDRDAGGPNDVRGARYDAPSGGPVTTFCAGDGTGIACPCGNSGAAGRGCASSVNPLGALLSATGGARIYDEPFQLDVTGLPSSTTVLFFQGTTVSAGGAGTVFGDGKRCASGTVVRLGIKTASGGAASYPGAGDLAVYQQGSVPFSGAVRFYQAWYRNNAAFCTDATFNLSNGLRVQWVP